jgi:hypothetical protein
MRGRVMCSAAPQVSVFVLLLYFCTSKTSKLAHARACDVLCREAERRRVACSVSICAYVLVCSVSICAFVLVTRVSC